MNRDLTKGPVLRTMLRFSLPMILGNLLQQCYNLADTWVVGRFLGSNALAAVGSSFTLMTFLTSILLGLCMGSGAVFSMRFGQKDERALKESVRTSFLLISVLTVILNVLAFVCLDGIRIFLQVPDAVWDLMRDYLKIIFCGIAATFLYNFFASYLRAVGNSVVPLWFLAVSAVLNIGLVCRFGGNADYRRGRSLFANRRRVLFRHRHFVFALRPLSRGRSTGYVGCAHGSFFGHARVACLCAFGDSRARRGRDLVVCAHRLGACRCRRYFVLRFPKKETVGVFIK